MQSILNELYKTNLKFRVNNDHIHILDQSFNHIATIIPNDIPRTNPLITKYLKEKGEINDSL